VLTEKSHSCGNWFGETQRDGRMTMPTTCPAQGYVSCCLSNSLPKMLTSAPQVPWANICSRAQGGENDHAADNQV
jgi:hypothetical protein